MVGYVLGSPGTKFGGPGGRGGETGFDQGTRREKKDFTSVGQECGAPPQHRNSTLRFDAPGIPRKKMHAGFEFLGVVLRNSIDKFRFEIQEESVGSAPGGGAGLSRAYARAEQRFIDPHPRGPGSRSDQFIRIRGPSQDHRSLRVYSRANFLSATSGAYQTQGPTLTLLKV